MVSGMKTYFLRRVIVRVRLDAMLAIRKVDHLNIKTTSIGAKSSFFRPAVVKVVDHSLH